MSHPARVIISSGVRTPIGKYMGALREIEANKLGALVLNEAIRRSKISPEIVDDVVMGQSYQNGESVNIARMSLLSANWPVTVPGVTVDRRCLSGLESICTGAMKIMSGLANVVVAGGVESMSRAEYYIPGDFMKWGTGGKNDGKFGFMPRGHGALGMWGVPLFDRIQRARVMSQPVERFGELNSMMSWAEAAAKKENISRQEADQWSYESHQKALAAIEAGKFNDEIVAVIINKKRGDQDLFDRDETPRADVSMEKLARLKTVYADGICTAGNSSTENDGAAAVVLVSEEFARDVEEIPNQCYLLAFAVAADDPRLTYPAVPASAEKALEIAGLTLKDIDLIEIQEAFAAQALADARLMGLGREDIKSKVNVNGSGISLGHPIAATGTIRMVTLMNELKKRNARYGLVTICGGGGQGMTAIIENIM